MKVEFSHKPVYFTMMVAEFFTFMVFSFLKKLLNQGIFQHALLPSHNSQPTYYHYPPLQAERNYSFIPGSVFLNLFSPAPKSPWGNYNLIKTQTKFNQQYKVLFKSMKITQMKVLWIKFCQQNFLATQTTPV